MSVSGGVSILTGSAAGRGVVFSYFAAFRVNTLSLDPLAFVPQRVYCEYKLIRFSLSIDEFNKTGLA